MAGKTKSLSFSEGVTVSTPTQSFIDASGLDSYATTAAYVTAKGSAAAEADAFWDTTNKSIRVYDGTTWQEIDPTLVGDKALTTKTTTYTITASDRVIRCDASGGAFTVTLPAAGNSGRTYEIIKVDTSDNAVTIAGDGAENIDDANTLALKRKYQSAELVDNGTGWNITSSRLRVDSFVRLSGGNGHGSTNTVIRRFTTTVEDVGDAITYADSSTNGATFTVNEEGIYFISVADGRTAANPSYTGLSLNSSQLTTGIPSITETDALAYSWSDQNDVTSIFCRLDKDDVVRVHTDGTPNKTTDCKFYMAKLGSL